jgi:hypothetical protein
VDSSLLSASDRIGRIFADWTSVYFGELFLKLQKKPTLLYYFLRSKIYVVMLTKMCWATFWAIFSQTHLVTLADEQNVSEGGGSKYDFQLRICKL